MLLFFLASANFRIGTKNGGVSDHHTSNACSHLHAPLEALRSLEQSAPMTLRSIKLLQAAVCPFLVLQVRSVDL